MVISLNNIKDCYSCSADFAVSHDSCEVFRLIQSPNSSISFYAIFLSFFICCQISDSLKWIPMQ